MKKVDTKFSMTVSLPSYRFLVKSLIFTISTLFIISTECSARSALNTCLPGQKTRCSQCYRAQVGHQFQFSCCDKDFKNCLPWDFLESMTKGMSLSTCEKARDAFGCDEYCEINVFSNKTFYNGGKCPSDKK
jgi:hypothetical protein